MLLAQLEMKLRRRIVGEASAGAVFGIKSLEYAFQTRDSILVPARYLNGGWRV
jgi:hypothetical protein